MNRLKITFWDRTVLSLLFLCFTLTSFCQETPNEHQAKKLFFQTYHQFTNPQGCSLSYKLNIAGLYKANGTIWTKGKMQKYIEPKYVGYRDGVNYYKVDLKRKVIEIYNANKKSKYASKFTFNEHDYDYSIANAKGGLLISLNLKKGASSSIKHAKVLLDKKTLYPMSVKVKVAFIWATIHISHFHPNIHDNSIFLFKKSDYPGYTYEDKR